MRCWGMKILLLNKENFPSKRPSFFILEKNCLLWWKKVELYPCFGFPRPSQRLNSLSLPSAVKMKSFAGSRLHLDIFIPTHIGVENEILKQRLSRQFPDKNILIQSKRRHLFRIRRKHILSVLSFFVAINPYWD